MPEHLYFSPFRFTTAGPAATPTPDPDGDGDPTHGGNALAGLPNLPGGGDGGADGGGPGTPGGMGTEAGQIAAEQAQTESQNAAPGSVAAAVNASLGVVGQSIADQIASIANQIGIGVNVGSTTATSPEAVATDTGSPDTTGDAVDGGVAAGQGEGAPGTGESSQSSDAGSGGPGPGAGTGSAGDTSGGDGDYARGGKVDWVRELVLGHQEGGYVRQGHRVDINGRAVHMNMGGMAPTPQRSALAMQAYNGGQSPPRPAPIAGPSAAAHGTGGQLAPEMRSRMQQLYSQGPMAGLPNMKGAPAVRPGMQPRPVAGQPLPPRAPLPVGGRPRPMPAFPTPGAPRKFSQGGAAFIPNTNPLQAGYLPEHQYFGQAGAPAAPQSPGSTAQTPQMGGSVTPGQQFDPANLPPIPEAGFPDAQTKINYATAYGQQGQPATPENKAPVPQAQPMVDKNTGLDFETANVLAGLPDLLNSKLKDLSSQGGLPSLEEMSGHKRGGAARRRRY